MMENENLFDRQLEQKGFERNNDTLIHPRDSSPIIQYVLFDFPIDESLSFIFCTMYKLMYFFRHGILLII